MHITIKGHEIHFFIGNLEDWRNSVVIKKIGSDLLCAIVPGTFWDTVLDITDHDKNKIDYAYPQPWAEEAARKEQAYYVMAHHIKDIEKDAPLRNFWPNVFWSYENDKVFGRPLDKDAVLRKFINIVLDTLLLQSVSEKTCLE